MPDGQLLWVSELNQKPEVLGQTHFPKKLKFYDTTLRDGEQTIGVAFDKKEKLQIAKILDELGVDRIEAGMPMLPLMGWGRRRVTLTWPRQLSQRNYTRFPLALI